MVKLEEAVIARIEHSGEKFELLVDGELVLKMRKGEQVSFNDLLAVDTVFKDARKGDEASPESLENAFGTTDFEEIVKKIALHGDVQLTTAQRKRFFEKKKAEIIAFISRNAINPQTNTPHPPQRIENAIAEAKLHIDPMKSAREQVPEIVKAIKKLIPISMETVKLAIKISSQHAGRVSSEMRKFKLLKEEWQSNGSYIVVIEIPAGMRQEVLNELNHWTHGELESKIVDKV